MAEVKQQFNVLLPADLVRRVKIAAINSGQSLSAFVAIALATHLTDAGRGPASNSNERSPS